MALRLSKSVAAHQARATRINLGGEKSVCSMAKSENLAGAQQHRGMVM